MKMSAMSAWISVIKSALMLRVKAATTKSTRNVTVSILCQRYRKVIGFAKGARIFSTLGRIANAVFATAVKEC